MVPVSEAGHPQPRREGVPQVLPAEFANAGPLQRRSEDETVEFAPVERTASVRVRELARQARRQRAENGEELTLGRGSLDREHLVTLREPLQPRARRRTTKLPQVDADSCDAPFALLPLRHHLQFGFPLCNGRFNPGAIGPRGLPRPGRRERCPDRLPTRQEGRVDGGPHRKAIPVPLPQPRLRAERQKGANPSLPLTDAHEYPALQMAYKIENIALRLLGEDMALRGDEAEEHPLPLRGQVDPIALPGLFDPMRPSMLEGASHRVACPLIPGWRDTSFHSRRSRRRPAALKRVRNPEPTATLRSLDWLDGDGPAAKT